MSLVHPMMTFGGRDAIAGLRVGWPSVHQAAEGAPPPRRAIPPAASVQQYPCFDLCGRRSRVHRWLQTAPGTTSARRGVVWVYVVVAHPGEVLPVCGKVLRGAVT